ncbi:hypothetical protein [Blautia hansenii]|uniref:hypothetical protein n=1 Tax=Blautia hansenii TaxID=1322 RepID=UPI001D0215E4|nr:hypothetical protein [Blautia hansenii]MCB5599864.1 hypothetical protein [Blautia hansenii]
MITQEQKDRYKYQQTESGKQVIQLLEKMKNQYNDKLSIHKSAIKTGRLSPLVNGNTGEVDRFIEY